MSETLLIARKLDDGMYVSIEQVNELKAKLNAENESLKTKLENVYDAVAFNGLDTIKRERRLKRALWLARAERAKAMYTYWHVKCIEGHLLYEHKWIVVEQLCMAKAEKYK